MQITTLLISEQITQIQQKIRQKMFLFHIKRGQKQKCPSSEPWDKPKQTITRGL